MLYRMHMPSVPTMGWQGLTSNLLLMVMVMGMASHLEAVRFPQELISSDGVDQHNLRRYPAFRGHASARLDFQLMTKIHDTLFIAGREQVYLVNLRESYSDQIVPYKNLTWGSSQRDKAMCALKGQLGAECQNFIKVLAPKNDDLVLICGTNAFNPKCRYYRLDNLSFLGVEISGVQRCPFDPKDTNVALFADGNLYSATATGFQDRNPVIYRSMGNGSSPRSVWKNSLWLKEPQFLHALEFGDYVYFFFREIAVEHNNVGKAFYSRVARVCKNDTGDDVGLTNHWTSFVKARLDCSVPGDTFFHFDVLQAITDVVDINGVPSVVGVFSTQSNSIPGSAVCAFSMSDIEEVFCGQVKEQKTSDAPRRPIPEEKQRAGCCAGRGAARFHPLIDASVTSIGKQPWFTKTQFFMERRKENNGGTLQKHKLTAIVVDNTVGRHKNDTVVFIGTEAGTVLKILVSLNGSILLDEIDVFSQANSEGNRTILSFHLERDTHSLYVGFSCCVVRLPLSHCQPIHGFHGCQRDPYCVWTSHGRCEHIKATTRTDDEEDVGQTSHMTGVKDSSLGVWVSLAMFVFLVVLGLSGHKIKECWRQTHLRTPSLEDHEQISRSQGIV